MWSIALERFISLYLSIYLFMYVCCVCMPVYGLPAHVEAETDGRCLPSLLFSTCFETWSLTEPTACHLAVQAGQLAPGILLLLHPPHTEDTDIYHSTWLLLGAGNLKLDPPACAVSTLPTEPSPRPLVFLIPSYFMYT